LLRALADAAGADLWELQLQPGTDVGDLLGGYEQVDGARRRRRVDARRRDGSGAGVVDAALARLAVSERRPRDEPPRFEWVDGPVVQAAAKGAWLVLDDANLCPPSVLDRLNALLEPGGALALAEGGAVGGEHRVVAPAPGFRVFLTVDPSFGGDVSRAMRNRCAQVVVGGAPPGGFRAAGFAAADAAAAALSRSAAPRLAWADALAGRAEPRPSVAAAAASGAWRAWPPLADEASALGADLAAFCDPARVESAALAAAAARADAAKRADGDSFLDRARRHAPSRPDVALPAVAAARVAALGVALLRAPPPAPDLAWAYPFGAPAPAGASLFALRRAELDVAVGGGLGPFLAALRPLLAAWRADDADAGDDDDGDRLDSGFLRRGGDGGEPEAPAAVDEAGGAAAARPRPDALAVLCGAFCRAVGGPYDAATVAR
ncbi:hypothetical protein AURANDRAFT_69106, partial [Aureococcus anophagefferens]